MRLLRKITFIVGLSLLMFSCSDVILDSTQASIQFLLTDMPGEYQQVNIDVVAVNVIVNDSLIELGTNQGIYNLLEFVNGKDTILVDDEIPSGYVSQIRLVLGEQNTVMIDSVVHDLKTPSAQQSGLKLQVQEEIIGGGTYAYVIDFVVDKSIVEKGNGTFSLKPVIRVFTETVTGAIEGVVQPADAKPLVMAIMNEDTVCTKADTVSGAFMIRGLEEGSYSVKFLPVEPYLDTLVSGIDVQVGQVTVMDTLNIK